MKRPLFLLSISFLFTTTVFCQNSFSLDLNNVLEKSYESGTVSNSFVDETYFERSEISLTAKNVKKSNSNFLTLGNYPNPSVNYTVVSLPKITSQVNITVTDKDEKIVLQDTFQTMNDGLSVYLEIENLASGYYIYTVIDEQNGNAYQGRVFKK